MARTFRISPPASSYIPGDSVIHRIPAGTKTLLLIAFLLTTAILVRTLPWALATAAATIACYLLARLPWRRTVPHLLTPLPVLLILGALMWWRVGFTTAIVNFLVILSAVALAILLTLTTRVSEMMDALERALAPLERCGVPVQSVSLAMSLTMRLIPLQVQTVNEVLETRKARGSGTSILAFGVPVIVRSLLRARAIGEALMSRGVGD